jgi:hypothetical protein
MPDMKAPIELLAKDLNGHGGVYCPNPKADLDVAHTGHAKCPYCSTEYQLKDGEHVSAH